MEGISYRFIVFCLLVVAVTGQHRWVWGSSRRSERQLDLHRPTFLRPAAFPPAAPLAALASPPAAAPFGLVPSASSLDPHGRPDVRESSSFSVPVAQTQVSPGAFQLRPRPVEPLVFRPLPIDISKLPLETSLEEDPLKGELHPPFSPLPLAREAALQDLTRSVPFRPAPGPFTPSRFPQELSRFLSTSGSSSVQSQAFVNPPDISKLPLEGSSSDGLERFGPEPFAGSPVDLTKTRPHAPTPSSVRTLLPQSASSLQAINTRNEQLPDSANNRLSSNKPKPTRIFPPTLDVSSFLKTKFTNNKLFKDDFDGNNVQPLRGAIKFPKENKKSPFRGGLSAPLLRDSVASGSSSQFSSYAFPPPSSSTPLRASTSFAGSPRPNRSPEDFEEHTSGEHSTRDSRRHTLVFKKHFISKKGTSGSSSVPSSYVWLWPGEENLARRASSFSSPAKHAL